MITYLYWILVIAIAMAILFFLGRADKWKIGLIGSLVAVSYTHLTLPTKRIV